MKCDSCSNLISEPPDLSSPHGEIYCLEGHWKGMDVIGSFDNELNDPWKFCKDYKENT